MEKPDMPHPGHDKHLCYLNNLGYPVSNPEDYKLLVREPRFLCTSCGRVAASDKNLCKPAKL